MPELLCSAATTEISCTWSQPSQETVTNYLLSWHYTGPCTIDAQSFLLEGTTRFRELQNLQEGGHYDVSLNALNGGSQGPAATVSVTTQIEGWPWAGYINVILIHNTHLVLVPDKLVPTVGIINVKSLNNMLYILPKYLSLINRTRKP